MGVKRVAPKEVVQGLEEGKSGYSFEQSTPSEAPFLKKRKNSNKISKNKKLNYCNFISTCAYYCYSTNFSFEVKMKNSKF